MPIIKMELRGLFGDFKRFKGVISEVEPAALQPVCLMATRRAPPVPRNANYNERCDCSRQ